MAPGDTSRSWRLLPAQILATHQHRNVLHPLLPPPRDADLLPGSQWGRFGSTEPSIGHLLQALPSPWLKRQRRLL